MEGENCVTKTKSPKKRDWSQMKHDILVNIFSTFHMMDVIMNVSKVCHSWYAACADPIIWKNMHTLDLSILDRYYVIPPTSAAWKDERSSRTYSRILRDAFDLSNGTMTKLVFHYLIHINDEHLNIVTDRCPRLKNLVLPRYHSLSLDTVQWCLTAWGPTLESLMIPKLSISYDHAMVIGQCCPNLKALKFMTQLNEHLATSIVRYLPNLKQLSIRGTTIRKPALEFLMNGMKNLEVLNITHSLIILGPPQYFGVFLTVDSMIKETTRRPPMFLTCHINLCEGCEEKFWDNDGMKLDLIWCEYREDVWRVDEISSLSY